MARVNMYRTLCNLVQAAPYQFCLHVLKDVLAAEQVNNPPQTKHAFYIRKKSGQYDFVCTTNLEGYNPGVGYLNVGSGRRRLHSSNFTMSIKNDLLTHLHHSFPSIFHQSIFLRRNRILILHASHVYRQSIF